MSKKIFGWDKEKVGDIDHSFMKPPFIRLAEWKTGKNGDVVSLFDLRVKKPNKTSLDPIVLHSIEHILLEGFRYFIPDNLVNVAPMGCQTGFYIVLLNFSEKEEVISLLIKILERSLTLDKVPYSNDKQCGQAVFHDKELANDAVQLILDNKDTLENVF